MDRLGQWIDERCVLLPTARVQASFAYRDYKQALAIRPVFAPAIRELSRFKVVNRSARA